VAMKEPEEIPDEAHEQLYERVAAIDVAKDSGKVCLRLPAESGLGRRVSRVWDVRARSRAVSEPGAGLVLPLHDISPESIARGCRALRGQMTLSKCRPTIPPEATARTAATATGPQITRTR
jgi:hypothetical protein